VQTLDIAVSMVFIYMIMTWKYQTNERVHQDAAKGIKTPWPTKRASIMDQESAWHAYCRDMILEAFLLAQPFVFAWQLSDMLNLLYYELAFHPTCSAPYTNCGDFTIWMNFWFACLLTLVGIVAVPILNRQENRQTVMSTSYGKTLLKDDKQNLTKTIVRHQLVDKFFGISIGWAWTKVAATECQQHKLLTCPQEVTGESTAYFLISLLGHCLVVCATFHAYMRKNRLDRRMLLMQAIETGNAKRIFKDADTDGSNSLSKTEMAQYLEKNGINAEIFVEAFDRVDAMDGASDGECEFDTLVREFKKVMIEKARGLVQERSSGLETA